MSESDDKELLDALKQSMTPIENAELERDLWPRMLQRLDQRQAVRISWFDWALVVLLGAACLLFPGVIPALAYHF